MCATLARVCGLLIIVAVAYIVIMKQWYKEVWTYDTQTERHHGSSETNFIIIVKPHVFPSTILWFCILTRWNDYTVYIWKASSYFSVSWLSMISLQHVNQFVKSQCHIWLYSHPAFHLGKAQFLLFIFRRFNKAYQKLNCVATKCFTFNNSCSHFVHADRGLKLGASQEHGQIFCAHFSDRRATALASRIVPKNTPFNG